MERLTYLAGALPSIVVALALITVTIRFARPIYQSVITLIAAYVLLFLPRAMVALRAALLQAPPELEDAARALGSDAPATLRRVVLPLAAPGIFSAAALVFIAVRHRTDRHAAARPDRHDHPGHPVLEPGRQYRLRAGGPVRGDDDHHLGAGDLPAAAAVPSGAWPVSTR